MSKINVQQQKVAKASNQVLSYINQIGADVYYRGIHDDFVDLKVKHLRLFLQEVAYCLELPIDPNQWPQLFNLDEKLDRALYNSNLDDFISKYRHHGEVNLYQFKDKIERKFRTEEQVEFHFKSTTPRLWAN